MILLSTFQIIRAKTMILQVSNGQIDYIFKKRYYDRINMYINVNIITKKGNGHMNNIGYRNLLVQYIDRLEAEQPILTTQITQYVAKETGLDETDIKKAVNVNMARLEKADKILRIEKGVYCKKIKTAFGYYSPNRETLFCKQLLYNEDDVIGYETGLSALNRLGLVSQMPKRKCIATNRYTKKYPPVC